MEKQNHRKQIQRAGPRAKGKRPSQGLEEAKVCREGVLGRLRKGAFGQENNTQRSPVWAVELESCVQ